MNTSVPALTLAQGHDAHHRERFDAIAEQAQVLNLRWLESLAGLVG